MKPQYEPKTDEQKLGYLIEECGEVLAAVGKSIRWGLDSVNPELSPEKQETNRAWLMREMADLSGAIERVREMLWVCQCLEYSSAHAHDCRSSGKPEEGA